MESNIEPLARLDLNKLLTFLAIAEAGGVSAAARRLALTRSAVSHSLGVLESQLGVALFHRVGRRLVLTRAGASLRAAVRDARDRLGLAIGEAVGAAAEVREPVRVGLFLGFSRFRLAEAVDRFLRAHPHAQVRVVFGPQAWLVDQLVAGRLDMTLSLRPTREEATHVRSQRLFVQSLVLAVRAGARRPSAAWADVRRLAFVDYYQSDPVIDRWSRHHFGGHRVPRERIRAWAASTDLALELVRRGAGAAVLPSDLVEPFRRRGELAVVPGPREPLRDPVWLNELRGARAGRAHAAFRAFLLPAATEPAH